MLIQDTAATNHLYRIAQEAVHNAIRHGKAKNVVIRLYEDAGRGTLSIEDDGVGLREVDSNHQGMGLNIMRYRAGIIRGTLEITRRDQRGTVVTCTFPI